MEWIAGWIVGLLSLFWRRRNDAWTFYLTGNQAFSGNPRALLHFLYHRQPVSELYVIDDGRNDLQILIRQYPRVRVAVTAWEKLAARLNSRFVVVSHNPSIAQHYFSRVTGAKIINVWHGIPIKGMANLDASFMSKTLRKSRYGFFPASWQALLERQRLARVFSRYRQIDLLVASGVTERALLAGCMLLDASRIQVTGMPRIDFLLCDDAALPADLQDELMRLRTVCAGRKLVLYAPTFRDGPVFSFGFVPEQLAELAALCMAQGAVLGVRPHPAENHRFDAVLAGQPGVLDLRSTAIADTSILLRETAVLISDYSSIWIDFLVLQRPVIGYLWDEDSYEQVRGLMYEYTSIFPGRYCRTVAELFDALVRQLADNAEPYTPIQARVRAHFFRHADCRNSERVFLQANQLLGVGNKK